MTGDHAMTVEQPDSVRGRLLAGQPVVFPASAAIDERTVAGAWVIEALRAGAMVSLENACIAGPVDLNNMQIRADVKLLSCEIQEFADFSYAVFERTLRLHRCTFRNGASFDSARLRSDVWFDESTFETPHGSAEGTTLFNDAEFSGVVSANSVKFTGGAVTSFERVRFGSLVSFVSARFEGEVDLSQIRVGGDLRLNRAIFLRPCSLEYAIVTGSIGLSKSRLARRAHASLSGAEVGRGVELSRAVVLGHLAANRARFGSIDGSEAVFLHGLVLDDTTVAGSVNFPGARFGRRYLADLRKISVGGQLDLRGALFKGPLRMDDSNVGKVLHLERSRFARWAKFDRLEAGAVDLTGARFESHLQEDAPTFSHVMVHGAFDGRNTRFQKGVVITHSKMGECNFNDARAYGTFDLGWTTVSGILSFSAARARAAETAINLQGVSVGNVAWFDGARFAGKVFAIGLHVQQQLSWNNVITLGDADFYEINVGRGVFMQSSTFGGALKVDRARLAADVFLCGAACRGRASFDKSSIAALDLGKGEAPHDRPAVFHGGVSLQHCQLGYLNFREVTINDNLGVGLSRRLKGSARARPSASFNHCQVSGVANFSGAKLGAPAQFYGVAFFDEALFQRTEFSAPDGTDFSTSTFKGRAVFYRAQFAGEVDFSYARFENAAMFRARFRGKATFDMCRFLSTAEFSDASTIYWEPLDSVWTDPDGFVPGSSFADASFVQTRFGGDARFDSAKFTGAFDLREAILVSLYLASDSDPATESALLPSRIGLVGCRYEQVLLEHPHNLLMRDGKRLRLLEGYDRQPFTQLENSLRRAGNDRAADRIYLAGRRAERQLKPPVSRLFDWVYGALVNYGVKPWRLACLALLSVSLGAWFFSHPGTVQVKEKEQRTQSPYPITWPEAINFGVAHFLPVSLPIKDQLVPTSQVVSVPLPIPGMAPALVIRTRPALVATLLQLAGWILVPIGVAAMTGVLMRKTK